MKLMKYLVTLVLMISMLAPTTAMANVVEDEKIVVLQVGTSLGKPTLEVDFSSSNKVGTYRLIITNPQTKATYGRDLKRNEKNTFTIDNFTTNGTYQYTLHLNGVKIMDGGVNLTAVRRTPTVKAVLKGSTLTLDISGGYDYEKDRLGFKSGTFEGGFTVTASEFKHTFTFTKGVTNRGTLTYGGKDLSTIPIEVVRDDEDNPFVDDEGDGDLTPGEEEPDTDTEIPDGGNGGFNPGTEDNTNPGTEDNTNPGTGDNTNPGTGNNTNPGNGGGTVNIGGGGGTGTNTNPGNSDNNNSNPGNGGTVNIGGGGGGGNSNPGTVERPNISTGGSTNTGSVPPSGNPNSTPNISSNGAINEQTINPAPEHSQTNNGGGSSNVSSNGAINEQTINPAPQHDGKFTLTLNKREYKLNDMIIATAKIADASLAGRAVTVAFGVDSNIQYQMVEVDRSGNGEVTVRMEIPQPSSKVVVAGVYSVAGSLLMEASAEYVITDETPGASNGVTDEDDDTEPRAKYVAADLRTINKEEVILSVYEAKNLKLYTTKLAITNETTGETRQYAVFVPDGDSRTKLKVVYDGSGIYTWKLYSGGKLIAKSPYATPVEVDNPGEVSNDGLPILNTAINQDVKKTHLEGLDPEGVTATDADLNNQIGGEGEAEVPADDVTGIPLNEPFESGEEEKSNLGLIIGIAVILLLFIGVVVFMLKKKKKQEEQRRAEEERQLDDYEDDDDDFDDDDED